MRRNRIKQDAAIAIALIIVVLALWRLRSNPERFGGVGQWAASHVFGSVNGSLFHGPVQEGPPTTGPVAQMAPPIIPMARTNSPSTNIPATIIADLDSSNFPNRPTVVDAATMDRRLGEVGAKGGDIQFSLFWRNYNDLDLHCVDPAGEEIFFSNKRSQRTGGELDVDQNANMPFNATPVENIYWPPGGAPPGRYVVSVVYYAQHGNIGPTPFTIRTVVKGKTNTFSGTIFDTGRREHNRICILQYDPANPNPALRYAFLSK